MRPELGLALSALLVACGPAVVEELPEDDPGGVAAEAQGDAQLVTSVSQLRGPRLRISVLDIGQGDGILLKMPNGRTVALDGGPSATNYLEQLSARGVERLDYMLLSHAHADHYQGLIGATTLLPNDCGRRVLDPGYDRQLSSYQQFLSAAGCRYRWTGVGQSIPADPAVQLNVLYASDMPRPRDESHGVNNTSVMLRLRYGRFSMLFAGDAEAEAEEALYLDQGSALRSTVLKAGHHGSCTATARRFLQAVAPRYVVMSLGRNNVFGMPHCQTMGKLSALRGRGLRWARTDLNGEIEIVTDGSRYVVERSFGAESQEQCPRDCGNPLDF